MPDEGVGAKAPLSVLEEAIRLVNGQRQNDYGPPKDCLEGLAKLLSILLRNALKRDLTPFEANIVNLAVKVNRLSVSPEHRDTWVDIAGYVSMIDHLEGTK